MTMSELFTKKSTLEITNEEAKIEMLTPHPLGFDYTFEGHVVYDKYVIRLSLCAEIRKYSGDNGYYVSTRAYKGILYAEENAIHIEDNAIINFVSRRFSDLRLY